LIPIIKLSADYVNCIDSDKKLELITTVLYLIQSRHDLSEEQIIREFKNWSDEKDKQFTDDEIKSL
jgi:hypothetical protein